MSERFTMRVALARRCNTGWQNGKYSIPGGHVDGKETIAAAALREIQEEIGITIDETDLELIHTQHRIAPDAEYIDFDFNAKKWIGEPTILEPDKCDDLRWFPIDQLPDTTAAYVRHKIECIRKGISFSEWSE
jgi:8-oxo-dGTP diphosphatase